MSEWANFRSTHSSSGWSARGGQARNPYALDRYALRLQLRLGGAPSRPSCAAVASAPRRTARSSVPRRRQRRRGHQADGGADQPRRRHPHLAHARTPSARSARTVADAAAVLGALAGVDPRDPATAASAGRVAADYTQFLDPDGAARRAHRRGARDVLRLQRAGRRGRRGGHRRRCKRLGAVIVDPADIPTAKRCATRAELDVLLYEFKADLNAYLARAAAPARRCAR